jgi:hypothetical protein
MSTQALLAKYESLSKAAQESVDTLVEALAAAAQARANEKRFSFDWAGGLEDLKGEFTAVELQHHMLELR